MDELSEDGEADEDEDNENEFGIKPFLSKTFKRYLKFNFANFLQSKSVVT